MVSMGVQGKLADAPSTKAREWRRPPQLAALIGAPTVQAHNREADAQISSDAKALPLMAQPAVICTQR